MDWLNKMTTKSEIIKTLKKENPTLQIGDEDAGYTQLSADEYETIIDNWADVRLAKEQTKAEAKAKATAKAALLSRLGITAEEAQLLLS